VRLSKKKKRNITSLQDKRWREKEREREREREREKNRKREAREKEEMACRRQRL